MVFTGTPQYQYGKSAKAATVVQDNENESDGMQTGLKVASGKANNRIVKTVFSGYKMSRLNVQKILYKNVQLICGF